MTLVSLGVLCAAAGHALISALNMWPVYDEHAFT